MAAFDKIAIIGLGLIGSSIAHAARRAHPAKEIAGHDASADVLERAGKIGFCDTSPPPPGAVDGRPSEPLPEPFPRLHSTA